MLFSPKKVTVSAVGRNTGFCCRALQGTVFAFYVHLRLQTSLKFTYKHLDNLHDLSFTQDEMFSQPVRNAPLKRFGADMEMSSRKTEDSNKPPISRPAWINQPKREQTRKDARVEKETKPKSHRQRSYSEVENVEVLYSAAKSRGKTKHDEKKLNSVLSMSRSEDRLDAPEAQSTERVLTGQSVSTNLSDSNASAVPSKFTSREAVVKSQKPTTKPLHLGKSFYLYKLFQ